MSYIWQKKLVVGTFTVLISYTMPILLTKATAEKLLFMLLLTRTLLHGKPLISIFSFICIYMMCMPP